MKRARRAAHGPMTRREAVEIALRDHEDNPSDLDFVATLLLQLTIRNTPDDAHRRQVLAALKDTAVAFTEERRRGEAALVSLDRELRGQQARLP